jgi:hypothetical protein
MPAKAKAEKLTKAQKQALHAALNAKFGLTPAKARQLIDENDGNLSRQAIESALTAYFRTLAR